MMMRRRLRMISGHRSAMIVVVLVVWCVAVFFTVVR
jgi:hypothetical protein